MIQGSMEIEMKLNGRERIEGKNAVADRRAYVSDAMAGRELYDTVVARD